MGNCASNSQKPQPIVASGDAPVQQKPAAPWKIKLGAEMPNFACRTTQSDFNFHDFLQSKSDEAPFTILFSHPADFTPVCTTELGVCHSVNHEFMKRGIKMIAISCDPVDSHNAWIKDILTVQGKPENEAFTFPIIADEKRDIVTMLGMLDPKEKDAAGLPLPARALILIGADKKVKFSILYPATTGRNFDEVLRAIDSVLLTANHSLATPVNWNAGDKCIVVPTLKTEDARKQFQDLLIEELPSKKEYFRVVKCPDMTDLKATKAVAGPAATISEQTTQWRINIGNEMPDFDCKTTKGDFKFHAFLEGNAEATWTILMSHPKDFTPVCTTELGMCEKVAPEFLKRGVKMIAVSCDPVEEHKQWIGDILHREDKTVAGDLQFPIIADEGKDIVTMLGMIDPEEKDAAGLPLPARALMLIDPDKKLRFSILYPATTGRNFSEVLRAVDSVMLTASLKLATPANWKQGDRCVVSPIVSDDEALKLFQNMSTEKLPSVKQYLRMVDCPPIKGMEKEEKPGEDGPGPLIDGTEQQKGVCC